MAKSDSSGTIIAVAVVGVAAWMLYQRQQSAAAAQLAAARGVTPGTVAQPDTLTKLLSTLSSIFGGKGSGGGGIGFGGGSGSGGGGGYGGGGAYPNLYDTSGPFQLSQAPPLYQAPSGTFQEVAPGVISGVSAADLGLVGGTSIDQIPSDQQLVTDPSQFWWTGGAADLSAVSDNVGVDVSGSDYLDASAGVASDYYDYGTPDLSAQADNVSGYV